MPQRSYTAPPGADIDLESYLQDLLGQGFISVAAMAYAEREQREGIIELRPDITPGTVIQRIEDGSFTVEVPGAEPVPAATYTVHVMTIAERGDFFNRPSRPRRVAAPAPLSAPDPRGRPDTSTSPKAKPRSKGGRPIEHVYGSAADYVEERILKMRRPLDRHPDGESKIQHAIDLMGVWFKKNDPKPPKDPHVRRWINDHKSRTGKWWDDDIVAQLERQNQNRPKL